MNSSQLLSQADKTLKQSQLLSQVDNALKQSHILHPSKLMTPRQSSYIQTSSLQPIQGIKTELHPPNCNQSQYLSPARSPSPTKSIRNYESITLNNNELISSHMHDYSNLKNLQDLDTKHKLTESQKHELKNLSNIKYEMSLKIKALETGLSNPNDLTMDQLSEKERFYSEY